ncbi:MAG: TIM barrel protein [Paracoccaceae bacterium]
MNKIHRSQRNAAVAGFDALVFRDEAQRADRHALKALLAETGLPVLALNCEMGGTTGCAAIPGMEAQARREIDAAIEAATDIGAGAVHVPAGSADNRHARETFLSNLRFALDATDLTVLIEPISRRRVPGYFLNNIEHAADIIDEISDPRLKIIFDVYHVMVESGDVYGPLRRHAGKTALVQISSFPERSEPEGGEIDFARLLPTFTSAGYAGAFDCEYVPATTVEAGLGWRDRLRDRMDAA